MSNKGEPMGLGGAQQSQSSEPGATSKISTEMVSSDRSFFPISYSCAAEDHKKCDFWTCTCNCHRQGGASGTPAIDAVRKEVDAAFPHGHSAFNDYMLEQMKTHSEKNKAYAGGGTALGNFERVARIMDNYPQFPITSEQGVLVMYMMKHLDAMLWSMCQHRRPPDDSLGDIAVYATILRCMNGTR